MSVEAVTDGLVATTRSWLIGDINGGAARRQIESDIAALIELMQHGVSGADQHRILTAVGFIALHPGINAELVSATEGTYAYLREYADVALSEHPLPSLPGPDEPAVDLLSTALGILEGQGHEQDKVRRACALLQEQSMQTTLIAVVRSDQQVEALLQKLWDHRAFLGQLVLNGDRSAELLQAICLRQLAFLTGHVGIRPERRDVPTPSPQQHEVEVPTAETQPTVEGFIEGLPDRVQQIFRAEAGERYRLSLSLHQELRSIVDELASRLADVDTADGYGQDHISTSLAWLALSDNVTKIIDRTEGPAAQKVRSLLAIVFAPDLLPPLDDTPNNRGRRRALGELMTRLADDVRTRDPDDSNIGNEVVSQLRAMPDPLRRHLAPTIVSDPGLNDALLVIMRHEAVRDALLAFEDPDVAVAIRTRVAAALLSPKVSHPPLLIETVEGLVRECLTSPESSTPPRKLSNLLLDHHREIVGMLRTSDGRNQLEELATWVALSPRAVGQIRNTVSQEAADLLATLAIGGQQRVSSSQPQMNESKSEQLTELHRILGGYQSGTMTKDRVSDAVMTLFESSDNVPRLAELFASDPRWEGFANMFLDISGVSTRLVALPEAQPILTAVGRSVARRIYAPGDFQTNSMLRDARTAAEQPDQQIPLARLTIQLIARLPDHALNGLNGGFGSNDQRAAVLRLVTCLSPVVVRSLATATDASSNAVAARRNLTTAADVDRERQLASAPPTLNDDPAFRLRIAARYAGADAITDSPARAVRALLGSTFEHVRSMVRHISLDAGSFPHVLALLNNDVVLGELLTRPAAAPLLDAMTMAVIKERIGPSPRLDQLSTALQHMRAEFPRPLTGRLNNDETVTAIRTARAKSARTDWADSLPMSAHSALKRFRDMARTLARAVPLFEELLLDGHATRRLSRLAIGVAHTPMLLTFMAAGHPRSREALDLLHLAVTRGLDPDVTPPTGTDDEQQRQIEMLTNAHAEFGRVLATVPLDGRPWWGRDGDGLMPARPDRPPRSTGPSDAAEPQRDETVDRASSDQTNIAPRPSERPTRGRRGIPRARPADAAPVRVPNRTAPTGKDVPPAEAPQRDTPTRRSTPVTPAVDDVAADKTRSTSRRRETGNATAGTVEAPPVVRSSHRDELRVSTPAGDVEMRESRRAAVDEVLMPHRKARPESTSRAVGDETLPTRTSQPRSHRQAAQPSDDERIVSTPSRRTTTPRTGDHDDSDRPMLPPRPPRGGPVVDEDRQVSSGRERPSERTTDDHAAEEPALSPAETAAFLRSVNRATERVRIGTRPQFHGRESP